MSSPFGALGGASSAAQTPSPFGALNTSQPQPASAGSGIGAIFAAAASKNNFLKPPPAQTQPDALPTKTPFAGIGAQFTGTSAPSSTPQVVADATPPTGLFGVPTSQPQNKSLFGSVANTTTTQPLFPSMAATTQPQQPSLFGTATTTQPQTSASLGSLFGGLAGSQQPQQGPQLQVPGGQQSQQRPISQSASTNSQPAYFDALLERGRNRTNGKNGGTGLEEIPSLQLGLPDISRQVRQLGGLRPNAQQGNRADTRA